VERLEMIFSGARRPSRCGACDPVPIRMRSCALAFLLLILLNVRLASQCWADSATKVQNLQGAEIEPLKAPLARATVLIFTRTDCPISNRYAPVINELNEEFAAKGVVFWLVYVDPHQSSTEIQQHVKDYRYDLQVALDPKHKLVKLAAAVVTPEAAVFSSQGRLLYHGRIDNRYVDIGRRLPAPTRKDLELTLDAILAGRRVPEGTAPAIGCYISDLE
jgi:thiol-disulfide isomerase/thioredoxin